MEHLIPRHALGFAREALGAFPAVVIQGARQVGKSTFAGGGVVGIEVKSEATAKAEHFRGLTVLRDRLGDRFLAGIVVNTASAGAPFADRLMSLPVSALWEE